MIYELLPEGREKAMPAKELAAIVGASDTRTLRAMVRKERLEGAPICSTRRGAGGYYRPADLADLQTSYHALRHEAISILALLKTFSREIKRREDERAGQGKLL